MNSIGYEICSVARQIHQHLSSKFKSFDITPEQWVILKKLSIEDKISQKELSRRVEKDQNTVKVMVDKLEKKAFIKREKNSEDKRAFLLTITQEGINLVNTLEPLDQEMLRAIGEDFTQEELAFLRKMLSKVTNNLNT